MCGVCGVCVGVCVCVCVCVRVCVCTCSTTFLLDTSSWMSEFQGFTNALGRFCSTKFVTRLIVVITRNQ